MPARYAQNIPLGVLVSTTERQAALEEIGFEFRSLYASGPTTNTSNVTPYNGAKEMVAIDISKLLNPNKNKNKNKKDGNNHDDKNDGDSLDWIQVWKESDAKLCGFGACTKYEHGYRLFCGRGIKNIHIWNFTPPNQENGTPMWSCIYDTQSNGNTVSFLRFRHLENGHLQAISKSDGQKLRLWDLSTTNDKNSSRPPYKDIPHTEGTIGCYGAYLFGGAYSQMSVVYLDAEDT